MDRRDLLYEQYEDALFALLMDRAAEEEGARLIEENERLQADPNAAVPPEIDRRSRETIRRAFAPQRRRHAHGVGWVLSKAAIAVLVAALLFVSAYAAFPNVRVRTLNILIQSSNVASRLSLTAEGDEAAEAAERRTLAGYAIPDISEDAVVTDYGESPLEAWIAYSYAEDSAMLIKVSKGDIVYLDAENADVSEEVIVNGYSGVFVQKGSRIEISWYDYDHENIVLLSLKNANRTAALYYANQIVFVN